MFAQLLRSNNHRENLIGMIKLRGFGLWRLEHSSKVSGIDGPVATVRVVSLGSAVRDELLTARCSLSGHWRTCGRRPDMDVYLGDQVVVLLF